MQNVIENILNSEMDILQNISSFIKILIIYLFLIFSASFSSIFFSIIDCFNVFWFSKVKNLIQSRLLVYGYFDFQVFSFVINIAIDVTGAVLLVTIKPTLGLNNDNVDNVKAEPDPIKV